MLVPAITKKEEIQARFSEILYTDKYFWYTGTPYTGRLYDPGDGETSEHCFASVDKEGNVIGFLSFYYDFHTRCASNFGLISFDERNVTFSYDLMRFIKFIEGFDIHRIEWRMIGGNPVQKHYDYFCKKFNGRHIVLKDTCLDRYGNYHDEYIYEIIFNNK